jgi:type IV secretion system protein VirB8
MIANARALEPTQPAKQRTTHKRVPQAFAEAAADFERSKLEELKRSRTIAWRIAGAATAVAGVAVAAAFVAIVMRTEPEPIILKVDNSTGATAVLRSIRDSKDQYDEVVNKYWLAQYVRTCEAYDWYTIGDQFEACKLMSEDDVAKEYARKVQAPESPLKVLKDKGKVVVKVGSIVFLGDSAQVRYTSEKLNASGENLDNSPVQKWIATVVFQFKPGQMTEQQRLVNPLGFKAVAYRIDPEVVK